MRIVKGDLNEAVSRNNGIKRVAPCRYFDGHIKEPYEMYMALGARPYVQLFLLFSPPAHLCPVAYTGVYHAGNMLFTHVHRKAKRRKRKDISLHVTLKLN